eukprot:jgi/Galph1/2551/GphlegSOOS_G1204.1
MRKVDKRKTISQQEELLESNKKRKPNTVTCTKQNQPPYSSLTGNELLTLENIFVNDEQLLSIAVFLCKKNVALLPVIRQFGLPKLERQNVFQSLVRAIVSQQLSGKAALAILNRLHSLFGVSSIQEPQLFLKVEEEQWRQVGLSKRKVEYLKALSCFFLDNQITDNYFDRLTDEELMKELQTIKGIGPWSVHMLMIFALQRQDVLPTGDLGIRKGASKFFSLSTRAKQEQLESLFEEFRPYRTYASWLMWKINSPQFIIAMNDS